LNTTEQQYVQVAKSVNEELKQATFLVLSPEETDLHGDIYSEDEVRKACHNFNQHSMAANLLHLVDTDTFSIVESYIAPVDMVLNDKVIKSGSWMCTIQVHSDEVWSDIKNGNLTGVSISGIAKTEYLED
jgi:hypothetical protein